MARTFIRQDIQVGSTLDTLIGFLDNAAAGAAMESGAATVADDLNNLRAQVNRITDATGAGSWFDAVPTVNAKQRGLLQINTDLDDVEEHRFCFRTQILQSVAVPAAQNFVVLSVAGTETPTETAAVGAVTTEGAIVAAHGGTFGTHSLAAVAGSSAIQPANMAAVVDGAGDPVLSGGKRVWALLHSEVATDGHTFNDTTQQVQLSFVRVTAAGTALEAVPSVDIASTNIQYSYKRRLKFDSLPEDAFIGDGAFVDQAAAVDVTLDNAIDNQAGAATQAQSINVDIANTFDWCFRDVASADLLCIRSNAGAGTSEVEVGADVDLYDNRALDVDFQTGASLALGSTRIDVGVTAGTIETTGSNDLRVLGAQELFLDDGNQAGSTWAQTNGVKLSETTAEWDAYETAFGGEVSILNAIVQANGAATRTKVQATLTSNVTALNDINGPGTPHANTDVDLAAYDSVTFTTDVDVFLNGELMRHTDDVIAGGTPADGDLQFTFNLKGTGTKPDQITVIVNGQ